jgi:hypothetical protein
MRWRLGEVIEPIPRTARIRSLVRRVPDWPGHRPGQRLDLHLTAEDSYQAVRSSAITSPPEADGLIELVVARRDTGEVSPARRGVITPGEPRGTAGDVHGAIAQTGRRSLIIAYSWWLSLFDRLNLKLNHNFVGNEDAAGIECHVPRQSVIFAADRCRCRKAHHVLTVRRNGATVEFDVQYNEPRHPTDGQVAGNLGLAVRSQFNAPALKDDRRMQRDIKEIA